MRRCRWSAGENGSRKRLTVTGKIKKKEREEAMETETTGENSRIMEKQRAFFEIGKRPLTSLFAGQRLYGWSGRWQPMKRRSARRFIRILENPKRKVICAKWG